MVGLGPFSPSARALIDQAIAAAEREARVVGLTLGGSAVAGGIDEFSDLDFVVVHRDEQVAVRAEAQRFAGRLGPLIASFTGEHVGDPRLLICLYGPPLVHVDLKFVALEDLERRVEDGVVVWEREPGTLSRATAVTVAAWPQPDRQWIEDRFWVWVHYAAAKIGRGELFECLDVCNYFRAVVFGPLLAVEHERRPQGVRRLEQYAGDALAELEETVGNHTRAGCLRALRASIRLYQRLRQSVDDQSLVRRAEAEAASLDYLEEIAASSTDSPRRTRAPVREPGDPPPSTT